jgi:ubiquinone/menaquinone biosynthesis C-methylase UbiE
VSKIAHVFKSVMSRLYWFQAQGCWGIKDVFDHVYEGQERSETFRKIYRDVFGDDQPIEVDPCGFLTMTDLRNIAQQVAVGEGQTLADLACGRGGPGLWVARETGARLTGIEISPVAVEKARQRIAAFGLDGRATFRVGDFAATGCAAASFDAAMSVDAFHLVPDKTGSVQETARILKPGARFVFTTWEVNLPLMVKDYRPLLEQAGMAVERYEATPDWQRRQETVYQQIIAQQDALVREMGEASARFWIHGAQTELPRLPQMRRILAVARKR